MPSVKHLIELMLSAVTSQLDKIISHEKQLVIMILEQKESIEELSVKIEEQSKIIQDLKDLFGQAEESEAEESEAEEEEEEESEAEESESTDMEVDSDEEEVKRHCPCKRSRSE